MDTMIAARDCDTVWLVIHKRLREIEKEIYQEQGYLLTAYVAARPEA